MASVVTFVQCIGTGALHVSLLFDDLSGHSYPSTFLMFLIAFILSVSMFVCILDRLTLKYTRLMPIRTDFKSKLCH